MKVKKEMKLIDFLSLSYNRKNVKNLLKYKEVYVNGKQVSQFDHLLKIARKQKAVNIQNTFIGILISLLVVLLGVLGLMPWWVACIIYILESVLVLFNSQLIIRM